MVLLVDHREHHHMKKLMRKYIITYSPEGNQTISLDNIDKLSAPEKVEFVTLEVGDYADPEFGFAVERKSDDLWPEIDNGNLFAKLSELSQFPKSYFIIDKSKSEVKADIRKIVFMKKRLTAGQKHAEYNRRLLRLNGAMASCCLMGFPPVFCEDKKDAAQLIVRLYYKARDGKDRSLVNAVRPTATHKDRMMNALMHYPHIAEKTASKLLAHYGNVSKVNKGFIDLFQEPDKALMRKLGLDKRQLDNAVAILEGDV